MHTYEKSCPLITLGKSLRVSFGVINRAPKGPSARKCRCRAHSRHRRPPLVRRSRLGGGLGAASAPPEGWLSSTGMMAKKPADRRKDRPPPRRLGGTTVGQIAPERRF